ncbi:hypothetical protein [Pedobacter deserti]|uniref:hypothetical protein n=1 Tax=Pedobacter deserti TaxID=2817382 RepID=UPI00210EF59B|nr:hypothetical protein [Pedobacter sp. SYSU D00382]
MRRIIRAVGAFIFLSVSPHEDSSDERDKVEALGRNVLNTAKIPQEILIATKIYIRELLPSLKTI